MSNKRLFLVDFVCILPFGHNAPAVNYFREYFNNSFHEVIPLVCKDLPDSIDYISTEARQLPYLYSRNMIKGFIKPSYKLSDSMDTARSPLIRKSRGVVFKKTSLDIFEAYAIHAYTDIFRKYNISSNDFFFFHSASFYGIIGLIRYLRSVPYEKWPKIHFRFIGVMEFSSVDGRGRLFKVLHELIKMQKKEQVKKVFFSAEVPYYADKMSSDLGTTVKTTFYPPQNNDINRERNDVFTILCPGAGRGDKGFFELKDILYSFYNKYPNSKVRLIVQSIDQKNLSPQELNYITQLMAIPRVEVLPHHISSKEMIENYSRADLILLPYSVETYRYRGSAVLQEAISYCIPVVSYDGAGFSEIIKLYGNGSLCNGYEEMVDWIYHYLNNPLEKSTLECIKKSYITDFNKSYQNLWS